MKDALLVIDVFNEFEHEDGDQLLESFKERSAGLLDALGQARSHGVPVIYVNDHYGCWDGDAKGLVARALAGKGGAVLQAVAPRPDEPFIFKNRYSAFDHTLLELLLEELGVERLLLVGGATEACIVQTGIDARELGYKVTVISGACATVDEQTEGVALRYAKDVAGMFVVPDYAGAEAAALR